MTTFGAIMIIIHLVIAVPLLIWNGRVVIKEWRKGRRAIDRINVQNEISSYAGRMMWLGIKELNHHYTPAPVSAMVFNFGEFRRPVREVVARFHVL